MVLKFQGKQVRHFTNVWDQLFKQGSLETLQNKSSNESKCSAAKFVSVAFFDKCCAFEGNEADKSHGDASNEKIPH